MIIFVIYDFRTGFVNSVNFGTVIPVVFLRRVKNQVCWINRINVWIIIYFSCINPIILPFCNRIQNHRQLLNILHKKIFEKVYRTSILFIIFFPRSKGYQFSVKHSIVNNLITSLLITHFFKNIYKHSFLLVGSVI